jgi:hypothetical protein
MSDIVDILEKLGRDARLRDAAQEEVEAYLRAAGASTETLSAIVAADQRRLESMLGVGNSVCCLIYMPKESEEEQTSPSKVNEPAPDEEELVPAYSNHRRAA